MPDNILPPPHHHTLFREQRVIGVPEYDQVVDDKNALIRESLANIVDAIEHASAEQKPFFEEVKRAVANFYHGSKNALDLNAFRAELATMIDSICESRGIVFDHGLLDVAAPAP